MRSRQRHPPRPRANVPAPTGGHWTFAPEDMLRLSQINVLHSSSGLVDLRVPAPLAPGALGTATRVSRHRDTEEEEEVEVEMEEVEEEEDSASTLLHKPLLHLLVSPVPSN